MHDPKKKQRHSRNNVGEDFAFKAGDFIAQGELFLFDPRDLNHVRHSPLRQRQNRVVKVAMLRL